MWYAETRLVSVLRLFSANSTLTGGIEGPERIKGAYAYQSLLEYVYARARILFWNLIFGVTRVSQKGVLPLGSDFPVESVNPLFGFYAAVSRLSRDGTSPHGAQGW